MHVKLKDKDGNYISAGNGQDLVLMDIVRPNWHLQNVWAELYGADSYEEVFIKPSEDELMRLIRERRDRLLSQSDWTQLLDAPISDENKKAWKDYRQELRDITETVDLSAIVWPIDPNGNR